MDTKISCFKIINVGINTVLETESQKILKLKRGKGSTEKIFGYFSFYLRYPTLLHLPLLRFHCVWGMLGSDPEPEFVKLLRSPGIDSQLAGRYKNPIWRAGPPPHRLAESIRRLLKHLKIRALDCCDFGIDSQTFKPLGQDLIPKSYM